VLLVAGLALLAGLAVIALLLARPEQRTVPQVLGQTLDSAQVEIDAKGFKTDVKRRADPAPADTVIDQVPGAGSRADKGSTVTLIVSNGPSTVQVPDVVGLTTRDARRRLERSRLQAEISRESSATVLAGVVTRTDPGKGKLIERGSAVTLFVSTGPQQVSVPDVGGEQEADAVKLLNDRGLTPVVKEKASDLPQGTVVSQTPPAGLRVEEGTSVTVFVSNGKIAEVPDVTGVSQAIAEARLDRAGFTPTVRTRTTTDAGEDGMVISQSVPAGSKRTQGASVTIIVGQLAPPPPNGATP
jgi:serine/threonine-protein kinase